MTQEGDVVLVHIENNPAFFARVEGITADMKPGWYQVRLLVLQVPLVVITWILRETYVNGDEFTMGGRPVRMSKVVTPEEFRVVDEASDMIPKKEDPAVKEPGDPDAPQSASAREKGKVLSLAERRKKNHSS